MKIERNEKEELMKKVKRQNRILIALGIVTFIIVVTAWYLFREVEVLLPHG
jgi:uncharacterized membrane protein